MKHTGKRLVVALGMTIALMLAAEPEANAALAAHYDIDSLAFESESIALVTKVRERKVDEYNTLTTVRVSRSYVAGSSVHEGDEFELDFGGYSFEPLWGWSPKRVPQPSVSPDIIVFLAKYPKDRWRAANDKSPTPPYVIVPSGMRIFIDGKTHRFVQEMNPGGYGPQPGEGHNREGIERVIAHSIARAARARQVLAEPSSPSHTTKLVSILHDSTTIDDDTDFGEDRIGTAILLSLGHDHEQNPSSFNLDAFLDARARAPRVHDFGLYHNVPLEKLVGAATQTSRPIHQRLAAISLIDGLWFDLGDKPALHTRLGTLFSDSDPAIRKAACTISFGSSKNPRAFIDALVAQFPREANPNVRFALFTRARDLGVLDRITPLIRAGEMPLVMTEHKNGVLTIAWTQAESTSTWMSSIVMELRSPGENGRVVMREDVSRKQLGSSSSMYESSVAIPLTVEKPLAPGDYDLTVHVIVNRSSPDKVLFKRAIHVGQTAFKTRVVPLVDVKNYAAEDQDTKKIEVAKPEPPPKSRLRDLIDDNGVSAVAGFHLALLAELLRRPAFGWLRRFRRKKSA